MLCYNLILFHNSVVVKLFSKDREKINYIFERPRIQFFVCLKSIVPINKN